MNGAWWVLIALLLFLLALQLLPSRKSNEPRTKQKGEDE